MRLELVDGLTGDVVDSAKHKYRDMAAAHKALSKRWSGFGGLDAVAWHMRVQLVDDDGLIVARWANLPVVTTAHVVGPEGLDLTKGRIVRREMSWVRVSEGRAAELVAHARALTHVPA